MSTSDYTFQRTTENVWVRRCFGLEAMTSNMSQHFDGLSQITSTIAVSILSSPSKDELASSVQKAWIRLRFMAPIIACRTSRCTSPESHFEFRYTIPHSQQEAIQWAEDTIIFCDDIKTLYKKHWELRVGRYWLPSDDHYNAELHVSPLESENGWQFSVVINHNTIDGRNVFALMDLFFSYLVKELQNTVDPALDHSWGDEVVRLPPHGSFVKTIMETGSAPNMDEARAGAVAIAKDNACLAISEPWIYKLLPTNSKGDIGRLVKFSPEETAKIHAISKEKGATITQFVIALTSLALSETALRAAKGLSDERNAEVVNAFAASTSYPIVTAINHRHKFPSCYASLSSDASSPLYTADGVQLVLSMDRIRQMLSPDKLDSRTDRVMDKDMFWNNLVQHVAQLWKDTDTSLDAYFSRELATHMYLDNGFDPQLFHNPFPFISSIGDLGRLNILSEYLPTASTNRTLTVDDVIVGVRVRAPPISNTIYEYNGELSCHFSTASEFNHPQSLKFVTDIFEELISQIFDLTPSYRSIGSS